jgi:hypothetical protein
MKHEFALDDGTTEGKHLGKLVYLYKASWPHMHILQG